MISISHRDSSPIYDQVKNEFKKLIVSGVMLTDDKLPSVREVAANLAINPNTIQRAYRELEIEGYIYSLPGKGSFVSDFREVGSDKKMALLFKFDETVSELRFFGVTGKELKQRIDGGKEG